MPDDSIADSLRQLRQRAKDVFKAAPKPELTNEEKRKATEKAIGPRFREAAPKPVEPVVVVEKPATRRPKVKKGPTKY